MSSSACDDHHDSGPYCHCGEGHGPDVAIRSPRPPCLPLWGRCPVRTLGGEGCGLPQLIPPNSYFLTYFLGTSTWVPPM